MEFNQILFETMSVTIPH